MVKLHRKHVVLHFPLKGLRLYMGLTGYELKFPLVFSSGYDQTCRKVRCSWLKELPGVAVAENNSSLKLPGVSAVCNEWREYKVAIGVLLLLLGYNIARPRDSACCPLWARGLRQSFHFEQHYLFHSDMSQGRSQPFLPAVHKQGTVVGACCRKPSSQR